MAKRVQESDIALMLELYPKLGTYAAVAREVGFSASTVRKYIIENNGTAATNVPVEIQVFNTELAPLEDFANLFAIPNWGDLCILSDEEKIEISELWKELAK
jgi:hypothetical protein